MRGLARRGRIHTPRGGRGRSDHVQPGATSSGGSHSNPTTSPACLSPTRPDNVVSGCSDASTSNIDPQKKRGRGATRLHQLWNRDPNAPKMVVPITNKQPHGEGGKKLGQFLGTIARKPRFVTLDYENWTHVAENVKKDILKTIYDAFEINSDIEEWIFASLSKKLRDYKHRLKVSYYMDFRGNPDEAQKNCPRDVEQNDWNWLVRFWESEVGQMREAKGKENSAKQTMRHTSGTKSYARIRQEETVKNNGVEPSRLQMFYKTHTRKDGTPVDPTSAEKISQMNQIVNDLPEDSRDSVVEESIFSEVMGPDKHGRVKMMGLGAKPATVWGSRSTRQELEREVAEARSEAAEARNEAAEARNEAAGARNEAAEARRDADEARRNTRDGLTAFASIISQHLGGIPIDVDAILRGISTQGASDGNHSAPASSGDPLA